MDDAYSAWLAGKIGNVAAVLEQLKIEGWLPVTPDRQPYVYDLCPQLKEALVKEGFTIVATPVFQTPDGRHCCAKCRCMKVSMIATDKPEDMPDVNEQLLPQLIDQLKREQCTHVHAVMVARTALWGYLPPKVCVYSRAARIRPIAPWTITAPYIPGDIVLFEGKPQVILAQGSI